MTTLDLTQLVGDLPAPALILIGAMTAVALCIGVLSALMPGGRRRRAHATITSALALGVVALALGWVLSAAGTGHLT